MPERVQLRVEALSRGGGGLARFGDQMLSIPSTLPGELVEGVMQGHQLLKVKILEPSEHRISPPCRQAKRCGGCSLQHVSQSFGAQWKAGQLQELLEPFGSLQFNMLHASHPFSRRRASLAARRTKSGALIGFHARGGEEIIPVSECHLLRPKIIEALPHLEELVALLCSRKARLELHITELDKGLDIVISGVPEPAMNTMAEVSNLAVKAGWLRLTWEDGVSLQISPPVLSMGKAEVLMPPKAFLQATREAELAMAERVLEATSGRKHILDLFSGCGTFSLRLAEQAKVQAVELDRAMLSALMGAANHAKGLKPIITEARDLFHSPLSAAEMAPYDAVVLDPPRRGAKEQCAELSKSKLDQIIYVSCNPDSFVRDAHSLHEGGYRLKRVDMIDQFLWSTHSELIAVFSRA